MMPPSGKAGAPGRALASFIAALDGADSGMKSARSCVAEKASGELL